MLSPRKLALRPVLHLALAPALAVVATAGCRPKTGIDNPDVAAKYRENNKYKDDIVTGTYRDEHADQGKAIAPATLRSIEDAITSVFAKDFERCLEDEMDTQQTRFLRSVFTVEFHIDTKGSAGQAKILDIWVKKQDAKGTNIGDVDPAAMKQCIADSISKWVFEPAPEVDYIHTYRGQVGEAF